MFPHLKTTWESIVIFTNMLTSIGMQRQKCKYAISLGKSYISGYLIVPKWTHSGSHVPTFNSLSPISTILFPIEHCKPGGNLQYGASSVVNVRKARKEKRQINTEICFACNASFMAAYWHHNWFNLTELFRRLLEIHHFN